MSLVLQVILQLSKLSRYSFNDFVQPPVLLKIAVKFSLIFTPLFHRGYPSILITAKERNNYRILALICIALSQRT